MNIVKRMMQRAVAALLFIGTVAVISTMEAHAAYVSISSQQVTASMDFTGITPVNTLSVQIKNMGTNTNATAITWSGVSPAVQASSNAWRAANQYAQVTANSTFPGWAVQVYTNNMHVNANPKFTGDPNTVSPAGLVAASGNATLPLAWRVMDIGTSNTTSYATVDLPQLRPDNSGFTNYAWHFMKDLNSRDNPGTASINEGFVNSDDYNEAIGEKGWHFGEAPTEWAPREDLIQNIYVASNFQAALAQLYKTSTLTLELFHD